MVERFLIICSFAESLVRFRGHLIDSLLERGEVFVIAPDFSKSPDVCALLEQKGVILCEVRMARTGLNPFQDIYTFFDIRTVIKSVRPTLVMAYTVKPVVYGLLAARTCNIRNRFALITGLGYTFQIKRSLSFRYLLRLIVYKLYALSLKGSKHVFFQNPDDRNLFIQAGILADNVSSSVVNGSGVDTSQYIQTSPSDAPHFLLVARLLGNKGVREYVAAAEIVKRKFPDAVFSLAGWIDEGPDSITHCELNAWIANSTIRYLGRLSDVRPAISDCSVYVLPSYREGTPRTVLEAMAVGRAIITTDAPGCRETVVPDYNGFLVPVKNVELLAEAMVEFILDPGLIHRMGNASRSVAVKKYDVHTVNAHMLDLMGVK
ncbi:glycosyltransferase family 4 protein [Pseudomonas sp. S9]|uniref:glycosyltransferase family 4 protein n=1 Tax=Pseudomonas sp. S9 TaxID=686578 RepID=UPI0002556D36|nr:glycosyltransferase family 4 protein [Pseudomonas sp. S9]